LTTRPIRSVELQILLAIPLASNVCSIYTDPMGPDSTHRQPLPTELATAVSAAISIDPAEASAAQCSEVFATLARLKSWTAAVEARFTSRVRELNTAGQSSPPADLHGRTAGCSTREAHDNERRSDIIDAAPGFGDALANGHIGTAHVDALANITTKLDDHVRNDLLDRADDLLDQAKTLSPERFTRTLSDLARRLERDHGVDRDEQRRRQTFLSRKLNPATGMTEGRFALHPELANKVFGAVDRHVAATIAAGEDRGDKEFVERRIDRNRLAAEALGELINSTNRSTGNNTTGTGSRPTVADVTVIIDVETLTTGELHDCSISETVDGAPLPAAVAQRLACDGNITSILVSAHGTALAVGRTTRHATPKQRRALAQQYRNCAIGDCDTPFDRCEIHHILPWEHGGFTDLDNLLPVCSKHHHLIHTLQWQLILHPDRTLTIHDHHSGTTFETPPPTRRPNAA